MMMMMMMIMMIMNSGTLLRLLTIFIIFPQGSNSVTGASRLPRGHRRRGDSDSEDEFTSDHASGPDYDSAGNEVSDRILQALDRLHHDMKSVLRRLGSMEEAVLSRQVGCTHNPMKG